MFAQSLCSVAVLEQQTRSRAELTEALTQQADRWQESLRQQVTYSTPTFEA